MNKVRVGRKNRMEKMKWFRQNIRDMARFEYIQNGQYRVMTYAHLTDEELLIFRLIFGI